MILREVRSQSFRGSLDRTVRVAPVTALVGPVGAHRSNLFHALDTLCARSCRLTNPDPYDEVTGEQIAVTQAFHRASRQEVLDARPTDGPSRTPRNRCTRCFQVVT